MTRRVASALLAVVALGVALTGCGTAATTSSTGAGTTAGGTGTAPPASTAATSSATTTATTTTTATSASAGSRHSRGRHAARPVLPTPPAGLTPTAGYGSYAACQGTCTRSVPAALRRPLDLPAADGGPCPVTLRASGPVDENGSTQIGFRRFPGSAWLGAQLTWTASGSYTGPILIRGRQIGGPGAIGFGAGPQPDDELQLLQSGAGAPPAAGGGRAWNAWSRVTGPGCYAFQVDGTTFSEVLVFRAVG